LPVDTPWATVSAPWYVGRNGSDLLNVIWDARAPNGDPIYYEDPRPVGNIADGEPVLRAVAQSDIQRFDGLSVKVYYVVTNRDNLLLSVRESLPFIMQVGVAKPIFDRPEVEGADANDVLDPDKVPPTGATMVLTHTGTRDKDRFYLDWKGSVSGGSFSDHIDLIPATAGKPVRVTVPKQYVTANRNGTVVADYRIERGGETLGHSRELKLRIGVALDLKDPEIKEAPNNILQPIAAKDTLTAVVRAYPNMIGTQVSVTWTGTPGEGSKTEGPVNVTMQQDMEIPLPNSLVAFNLGKTVKVIYTVIRNGVPQDSDELILTVLPIADGDKNLPTPSIDGAVGDELDVTRLEEGAQLRIEKWLLQLLYQRIWLRFDGTDKNGNPVELVFWAGAAHQQASGLVTAARVAWLRGLKDDTELKVTFKLNFDKVADIDKAVGFPVRTYTVKATPALEIDTTLMVLDGVHFYPAAAPYNPPYLATGYLPDNAHQTREAQGGSPPYQYISSNPAVASIDSITGYVVSTGNGSATITVQDSAGETAGYEVTCQSVYELVATPGTYLSYFDAAAWLPTVGAELFPHRRGEPLHPITDAMIKGFNDHVSLRQMWGLIYHQESPHGYPFFQTVSVHSDITIGYAGFPNSTLHAVGYRPRVTNPLGPHLDQQRR
jgi:hypothetical protein